MGISVGKVMSPFLLGEAPARFGERDDGDGEVDDMFPGMTMSAGDRGDTDVPPSITS